MENKAQQKRIERGGQIYDEFVESLGNAFGISTYVSTPRTMDLEKYAILATEPHLKEILYAEMLREYLTNHEDLKLFVEKGVIHQTLQTRTRFL